MNGPMKRTNERQRNPLTRQTAQWRDGGILTLSGEKRQHTTPTKGEDAKPTEHPDTTAGNNETKQRTTRDTAAAAG